MSKVSVIIPCYNQGQYLDEAVQSVLGQTCEDFEIIIVDDGSTEEDTRRILDGYKRPKTRLIRTTNKGLANARNTGIDASTGKYILPLDADDKIGLTYLEKAVALLDLNENIGIVYSKADFFGDVSGSWDLPRYHFPDILYGNLIFCSAFFRKCDWAKVKGYDPCMIYGWEDYDLWLSLIALGKEVVCIPETLFFYRRRSKSMIAGMTCEQVEYSYCYLFNKHHELYAKNIGKLLLTLHNYRGRAAELEAIIRDVESSQSWKLT